MSLCPLKHIIVLHEFQSEFSSYPSSYIYGVQNSVIKIHIAIIEMSKNQAICKSRTAIY